MQKKFPTMAVFKEAANMPMQNIGSVFTSLLVFILASIVAIIIAFVVILLSGVDIANAEAFVQNIQNGQADGAGGILLGTLIAVIVIFGATSHVFNYWVNLSAFGHASASWSFADGRFKAMVVNTIKLVLIGVLILLVTFVVTSILSTLGLAPSLAEQASNTDVVAQYKNGLAGNIMITVSYCFIYSLFSANLTYTALQSSSEGMENPYVTDFAVVLIMLYAVFVIPSAIAAFIGSAILFWIVQLVLGLFVTFAIPAAHGVRYRFCTAQAPETLTEDES